MQRDEPLLGVRIGRLKLGGELRDLVDHTRHLVAVRRHRSSWQRLAAEAGCLHVRVGDLKINEVPALGCLVVELAVAGVAKPIGPRGFARNVVK
jgi:hypothetical protein